MVFIIISVKVVTKSSQEKVEKKGGKDYKVWVKSAPEKGKANRDVVGLLSDYFGEKVWIKSGHTSRKKRVVIP